MNLTNIKNQTIFLIISISIIGWIGNWFYFKNISFLLFNIFICCLLIYSFLLYSKRIDREINNILIKLSDVVASISSLEAVELFSTTEDNLLSKLQLQIIKLTNILKLKNQETEQEKDEIKALISDISHQLKTPLANLKMYSDLLTEEKLSLKERAKFDSIIQSTLNKLTFLIENMIKMSRLESGIICLKIEANNLNKTVLTALKQCMNTAKQKSINIELKELHQINLNHDYNWTTESIFNILDNAIKYQPKGKTIIVRIEQYELFARIDIIDQGIGINEEDLPKIFSRFYRGINTTHTEGLGIGLYLSRKIITMQGGYIKVSSNKKGSKFSIFLPLKK